MRTSRTVTLICDEPSRWTIIFERLDDGTLDIGLAHGDNPARQGVLVSAEDAERFIEQLSLPMEKLARQLDNR